MLEVPVVHRLAVEQVAAEERQCLLESGHASFFLTLQRATRFRDATLERGDVEILYQRGIDAIAIVRQHNPLGAAERAAQAMERHVEIVAKLRRTCLGPEREADLLLRPAFRMHQEIDQQLARTCRTPRRRLDGPTADEHLQWSERGHAQPRTRLHHRHRQLAGRANAVLDCVARRLRQRETYQLADGKRATFRIDRVIAIAKLGAQAVDELRTLEWRRPGERDRHALAIRLRTGDDAGRILESVATLSGKRDDIQRQRDAPGIVDCHLELQPFHHERAGVLDVAACKLDAAQRSERVRDRHRIAEVAPDGEVLEEKLTSKLVFTDSIRGPAAPEAGEYSSDVAARTGE